MFEYQTIDKMYENYHFVQITMHTISLSEFRANASAMIDRVAQGETVRILRHGKPVAELVPAQPAMPEKIPSWKRPIKPLEYQRADGKTLAQLIIEERESARY